MSKRIAEDAEDPENNDKTDLKELAIKTTFDTLCLEKRRKLAKELLTNAHVGAVCLFDLDVDDEKFLKWLHSGEKKSFTKEEVQNFLTVWNYVKKCVYYGYAEYIDDKIGIVVTFVPYRKYNEIYENKFNIREEEDGPKRFLTKNEFFDWVLENIICDRVQLDSSVSDDDVCYIFPNDTIDYDKHDITVENLRDHYGWKEWEKINKFQ